VPDPCPTIFSGRATPSGVVCSNYHFDLQFSNAWPESIK
jgi:hypothetical protein